MVEPEILTKELLEEEGSLQAWEKIQPERTHAASSTDILPPEIIQPNVLFLNPKIVEHLENR